MTDQPDATPPAGYLVEDVWRMYLIAMTALDAARAEAAEARARHADERCDMHARDCADAEARIANACVILTAIHPEVRTEAEHDAYRALTGDTE